MANNGNNIHQDDFCNRFKNRPLTIVAVGKTGKGKSSTLNSLISNSLILNSLSMDRQKKAIKFDDFKSGEGPDSVSSNVTSVDIVYRGFPTIRLVDTTGLFDTKLTAGEKLTLDFDQMACIDQEHQLVLQQFLKVIEMCQEGIDIFLFVLKGTDRATPEELETIQIIFRYLGWNMLDYVIFVITGKDQASRESFEGWQNNICQILEAKGHAKDRIQDRFIFVDNNNPTGDETQKLLSLVKHVTNLNSHPYTRLAFDSAQEALKNEKNCKKEEIEKEFQGIVAQELKPIEERHELAIVNLELQIAHAVEEAARIKDQQATGQKENEAEINRLQNQREEEKRRFEEEKRQKMAMIAQQRNAFEQQKAAMAAQIQQMQSQLH